MGRPSDRKHSAQRLGKRERARVKNFRGSYSTYVDGAGIVHVKAGRKKMIRFIRFIEANKKAHQLGNPLNPKIFSFVERPSYNANELHI